MKTRVFIAAALLAALTIPAWADDDDSTTHTITLAQGAQLIRPLGDFPAVRFVTAEKLPVTIHLRHLGGPTVKACLIEARYFTGRFPNGGCVWSVKVDSRLKKPKKLVEEVLQGAVIPVGHVPVQIHPKFEKEPARVDQTVTIAPGAWVFVLDNDGLVSNAGAEFSITTDIEY